MPFTSAELANIANAALDFYIKGPAFGQSTEDRPLLKALESKKKTFPGGKGNISIPVKGDYTTAIAGYSQNDMVSYSNPANIKRVNYPWKEIHAGITVTLTELKEDGISVVDSTTGAKTTDHSDAEVTRLTGLLEDKLDDMSEGWSRTFNQMLWLDGTQDAKVVPGLLSILTDVNNVGTVGGLDRATTPWWRHRVAVGANAIAASAANQTLSQFLRAEVRQLRRYGGKPTLVLAGSYFLQQLEIEVSAKGLYTQQGFIKNGTLDVGLADISMRGVGQFQYDPTLDDLGYSNRCYVIDESAFKLRPMEGEDKKTHTPARPYNQYALYRAMTWTGGLTCHQLNGNGVYQVQ
jgi:hypothetical protein